MFKFPKPESEKRGTQQVPCPSWGPGQSGLRSDATQPVTPRLGEAAPSGDSPALGGAAGKGAGPGRGEETEAEP